MSGKLGLFRLQERGYAVPLGRLQHVAVAGRSEPLPLTPAGIAGMFVFENEIIPLLDSDWLPGVEAGKGLQSEFKVLVTTEYGSVAFPADQTVGIVAESRCQKIKAEPLAGFMAMDVSYRENCYQVLNIDVFVMSLIRP